MQPVIHPLILCGGSGTRLWPLSRKSYPKQFVPLVGEQTLFQGSVQRLTGPGYAPPIILTNADFRFIVTEQLSEIGIDPGAILIEPAGRNTAPAILAAALWLHQTDPEALVLVAPSDHVVPDATAFRAAASTGIAAAQAGQIVTFGIKPTHPETGYGYLEMTEPLTDFTPRALPLNRFVEKPDAVQAAQMLASGQYLWNAGIFLFSVKTILAAFHSHAPELLPATQDAVTSARHDLGFLRLDPSAWDKIADISVDYAVMEKAENLSVVPYDAGWSDLGGWEAVWREAQQDAGGVATSGQATSIDCSNTLLRSEDETIEIVGIGLNNIVAIAMKDAVLVADTSRSQDVKLAVSALTAKHAKQATMFPKDHRPWGWFESLVIGDRFQVKRIFVHPGAALSLQSHHHRAEHWIVVEGTARVTIDGTVKLITEN